MEENELEDIEDRYEDEIPLRDIAEVRGDSSKKNEKTALNHFSLYMKSESLIREGEDYSNVCEDNVTPELLGKFADYLFRKVDKRDGALQYVSKVKIFLSAKYPVFRDAVIKNGYYSTLRANLKKLYLKRCIESNTQVRNTQVSMSDYDHKYICGKLMFENTVEANE